MRFLISRERSVVERVFRRGEFRKWRDHPEREREKRTRRF
jgi:hypothetical protein